MIQNSAAAFTSAAIATAATVAAAAIAFVSLSATEQQEAARLWRVK